MGLLAQTFKNAFDPIICARGEEYYKAGCIEEGNLNSGIYTAHVKGSRRSPYLVSFLWSSSPDIQAECTCPHYEGGEFCKHIWAVLLKMDADEVHLPNYSLTQNSNLKHQFDDLDKSYDEDEADYRYVAEKQICSFKEHIDDILGASSQEPEVQPQVFKPRKIFFVFNHQLSNIFNSSPIQIWAVQLQTPNERPKPFQITTRSVMSAAEPRERQVLMHMLLELRSSSFHEKTDKPWGGKNGTQFHLVGQLSEQILRELTETQSLFFADEHGLPNLELGPLEMSNSEPMKVRIQIQKEGSDFRWVTRLNRGDDEIFISPTDVILDEGYFVQKNILEPIRKRDVKWLKKANTLGDVRISRAELPNILASLSGKSGAPEIVWPEDLGFEIIAIKPQPILSIVSGEQSMYYTRANFVGSVSFLYGTWEVSWVEPRDTFYCEKTKKVYQRDRNFEMSITRKLLEWGAQNYTGFENYDIRIADKFFINFVDKCIEAKWEVRLNKARILKPSMKSMKVKSGIDWLEITGDLQFGEESMNLLDALKANKSGEPFYRLKNGSIAILPKDWLQKYSLLEELGESDEKSKTLKLRKNQSLLLDALLDSSAEVDSNFQSFREAISNFNRLEPSDAPKLFRGELRPYQQSGLSWLKFLHDFQLGGILADDMGLGKTIQVIALLLSIPKTKNRKPDLIVMPKTLVFNWMEEIQKFAPSFNVVIYDGPIRKLKVPDFSSADIILTTYPILRQDWNLFTDLEFRYAICDEAHLIKNAGSQISKICRLIKADHRLALTGTPVENSATDLVSLLQFVAPGLLNLKAFTQLKKIRFENMDHLEPIRRALGPIVLRRKKDQVLRELPSKTEITIQCELNATQRKYYEDLRKSFQVSLNKKIDELGFARSKVFILEALLRLRQASCHTGLIDKKISESAKVEALIDRLKEISAEGHKALVFSQFTSFLNLIQPALNEANLVYEYLDGKTKNRETRIQRFISDPLCSCFLISLKAGGMGLNLTAADYVFILDPWWNPAVETQAIDRAHRMGQTKKVIAYRMIAKGTIEEKIAELQKKKAKLAEQLISAESSALVSMTRQDLDELLMN